MSTVTVGVRLVAEGGQVVEQLGALRAQVVGATADQRAASGVAQQMAGASREMGAAVEVAAQAIQSATTAANENTASLGRARAAGDGFAAMAAQLRSELDPMYSVQQRFDRELERADVLFRNGAISAREYASAQQLANDNLRSGAQAVMGTGAAVGRSSAETADAVTSMGEKTGLARHHVQNLAFQFQDLGLQMTAAAGSSEPMKMAMMALMQQGAQINGIMSQAGLGIRGLASQMVAMVAPFTPLIAAGAALAAGVGVLTSEINKNSSVTVSWGDVVLGAFDAVKAYMTDQVTAAFAYFGTTTGDVWKEVVNGAKWAFNWIIGSATVVPRTLLATWKLIPAGVADIFISATNAAIRAINSLIEKTVRGVNGFLATANGVLGAFGIALPKLSVPQIDELANNYAGAGASLGKAFTGAIKDTVTRDFLGEAASYLSPFAEKRARDRAKEDAKKTGKEAGQKAGKAAGESAAEAFAKALSQGLNDMRGLSGEIAKALAIDREKGTQSMMEDLARQQAAATDGLIASAEANALWNDNLRDTVNLLGQIGGFGSVLAGIGNALGAMRSGDYSQLGGPVGNLIKTFASVQWSGVDEQGRYTRTLGDVLTNALDKVFGANGSFLTLLQGAGLGMSGSRVLLGERGGGVGSALGGAVGQKLGEKFLSKGLESIAKGLGSVAGPLGSIIGGLAGSLIGGLFGKWKSGAAIVTQKGVSVSGNDDQRKSALSGLGGTLQSSLDKIAEALGGGIGDYAVSLGLGKKNYRVSASGSSRVGDKSYPSGAGSDLLYDGPDAEEAMRVALANAISDGAIKGLSSAVQKALKSSDDVDKAVSEAMKTQNLELLLGGIGAELKKSFKDFERQAQDRLRIARAYGFDVVEVEKRNAEDRLKLSKELLEKQTGSLQALIDEMTSGSLFEGSAEEQRKLLLTQIAQTKAEADKGTEGAADKLAQQLEQLNSLSRDIYGTTGGFADDRALILDQARDTIAQANKRVSDAERAAEAQDKTNDYLDEGNDWLSKLDGKFGLSLDLLRQIAANSKGGTIDLSKLKAGAGY